MTARLVGQFAPDILCLYFLILGGMTHSRIMRVKVREYLSQLRTRGGARASAGMTEDALMRLYKLASGGTSDFVAVVLGGTSALYGFINISGVWGMALGWPFLLALVVVMHLLWSGATLDTVGTYAWIQKGIAIVLLLLGVVLKVVYLTQSKMSP